jgi:hypothetical protein
METMKVTGLKIKYTIIATLAFGLLNIMSCKEIGGVTREKPPLPDGIRFIEISVSTTDGSAMPSYVATVTNPDGSKQDPLTSNEPVFVVEDINNGTYSIAFTSDTHIGRVVEVDVALPAVYSDDYSTGDQIFLTKKNAPVVIDNQAGGTINVPPMGTGAGGLGSQSVTVTIPPGALEGTGTTSISVTPSPSTQDLSSTSAGNSLSGVEFTFEPEGLTFSAPITIGLPLDFPAALASVPTNFVYEATGETVPVAMSADGKTGTVQIDHFSVWTVKVDAKLTISEVEPKLTITYNGGCNEGLNEPISYTGSWGPIVANILQLPRNASTITVNGFFIKEALAGQRQSGIATIKTRLYTLATLGGSRLEVNNKLIPLCNKCLSITYSSDECHTSE